VTTTAWILFAGAVAVAVADWVAVWRRASPPGPSRRLSAQHETWLKPLTLVLLIGVAVAVDPIDDGQRLWFVAALVLSLAGDVFLLPAIDRFIPGLASFLLAHVAYVVGFWQVEPLRETAVLAVLLLAPVAVRVVTAVHRREPELTVPVVVYIGVIAAMVASALRYGNGVGIAGGALFAVSDGILAIDRFDTHRQWMPTAVMVTYHLAQGLLVLSLVVE
jgi:uncharacterized membrane protein YhhN